MRIVSKWQEGLAPDDAGKIGEALAFNTWKIAVKSVRSMQDERLYFVSKSQGLLVMAEFMIFAVHIADRLAHNNMTEPDRGRFIKTMADRCIDVLVDNRRELQGPAGDYRDSFVKAFNVRLNDYAEFDFDPGTGPGFKFYRYLGENISRIMGDDQNNKWAIDQVVEIEGPDVYESLRKSMETLSAKT